MAKVVGKVIQIIGPVIDVLPQISKLSSVHAAPYTYKAPGALRCSEPP